MDDGPSHTGDVLAAALARLATGDVPAPRTAAPYSEPPTNGFEEAAAVLGWFDPGTLRPAAAAAKRDLDTLVAEATMVIDDRGARELSIHSRRRVEVLRRLRETGGVERALAANEAGDGDALHRLIRAYATGEGVDLDDLGLGDLYSVALVCDWLREAGFDGLPSPTELADRTDLLAQLEPLELLLGSGFVGRKAELARLRALAGTGPEVPAAPRRRGRTASPPGRPDARMLALYGPGGIGKSTLIAWFLVGQYQTDPAARAPFAYLDFDRPTIDSSHPLSVLSEAVGQLGVQFPEAKPSCERIRAEWAQVLEHQRVGRSYALRSAVQDFATLVDSLDLAGRPLLLVLDTFEIVQYRSSEEVAAILRMLDLLVPAVPALRVVVAGRAGIPRPYADQLEIAGLDPASATELLLSLGVEDRALAERIARRYSGDPQLLKLAAADPASHGPLSGIISRAAEWFLRLDAAVIQRKLYERVLGHVHDPEVRRVANPGLVVRRVTPDIVLNVLAEPCRLEVTSMADAERICAELRRETSLVEAEPDGALVHRAELRRAVLPLLEADQPMLSQALHRAAVDYYARRPHHPRERAEEIYHRLKTGEPVETLAARWVDGVEPHLAGALDEFDGARRAFLAVRLGVVLDDRASREARLEDWERLTATKVRAMLDDDRPRDALTALGARRDRSPRSPLVALAAEAHFALGQVGKALEVLGRAADDALVESLAHDAVRLTRLQAELVLSAGAWDRSGSVDARLRRLGDLVSDPVVGLACTALRAALAVRATPDDAADLAERTRDRFDAVEDDMLAGDPGLVRLVGSLLGEAADVPRLSRAVRLAGLPRHEEGPVRVVAAEVANLDVTASARHGETPGMLARRHGVSPGPSLTAAWSAFLLRADDTAVRLAIDDLLGVRGPDPAPLATALARLLGTDPALRRPTEPLAVPEPDVLREVTVTPELRHTLADVLTSIFSFDSLRWFLRLRLHQSLDALVPGDQRDFARTVDGLISALEARGLLLELIARCREVAPGDPRLLEAAAAVGLATPRGDVAKTERSVLAAGLDTASWWRWLGQLEGQVCRLDIADRGSATGFLVGAALVLTSAVPLAGARPGELRCQFDAQHDRHGRLVTPGIWYRVRDLVATVPAEAASAGGWALLRVSGSPGVQPVGGDAVESSTGILRGWVDVARGRPSEESPGLLLLDRPPAGPLRLEVGRAARDGASPGDRVYHRLPTSPASAGAPIFADDLTPLGVHLGVGLDPARPELGVALRLASVGVSLRDLGLGHLLETRLA